jgi:4-hydroxy-2-oxoheptanedioate aldolase
MSSPKHNSFTAAISTPGLEVGMWVMSGSALVAEICAGSGVDWLLLDSEHSPNDLVSILPQLQAVEGSPVNVVVRPPILDAVLIKQLLDLGVATLLIPMVSTAEEARRAVAATRYPPEGIRGVGSSLARASRWSRNLEYLSTANESIGVLVQIETVEGLANAAEIAAVEGIDGVYIGPADLAAAMGHLGNPSHPDVVAEIERTIAVIVASGNAAGINTKTEEDARRYASLGATFITVGADVMLLARGSEALAARFADLRATNRQ